MHRWKIEEIETDRHTTHFDLYEKMGRWPFRKWVSLGSFGSKTSAEHQIQHRVHRPRVKDRSYYFEAGHEDTYSCW